MKQIYREMPIKAISTAEAKDVFILGGSKLSHLGLIIEH